jgi:hypothetical protein
MAPDSKPVHRLIFQTPVFCKLLVLLAQHPHENPVSIHVGYRQHDRGRDWLVRQVLAHANAANYTKDELITVEHGERSTNVIALTSDKARGRLYYHSNNDQVSFLGNMQEGHHKSETAIAYLLVIGAGVQEIPLPQANG